MKIASTFLYTHKLKLLFFAFLYYLKNNYRILFFQLFKLTSSGKKKIKDKRDNAKQIIKKSFKTNFSYNFDKLPENSMESKKLGFTVNMRENNVNNKISGCVYINDKNLENTLKSINNKYLFSNPLHPDIFPELIKMESESIKMVGNLFDLPSTGGGNITTGGTESTILALKAYKKLYMERTLFSFFKPEVLCTRTVHAAVNKACELLDLRIVYVDLDDDYVMDTYDLTGKISPRTCVIIGSAPCFPYGLMDPINKTGDIARYYSIPFHVDACLGGFITQFHNDLKLSFNDNIQSLSVDPHKFGLAPKGSSILLWKDNKYRHYQYFVVSDWTGGIYASVSLPGSRVGSQIATTWAALLSTGYIKYESTAKNIREKTEDFAENTRKIPNFEVIGNPDINVVAFRNTKYSVGQLSNYLEKHGWNINILQNPICLHICITPKNIDNIDSLQLLLEKFNEAEKDENDENITAIYGMAATIPDKSIIDDLVCYYLDETTSL